MILFKIYSHKILCLSFCLLFIFNFGYSQENKSDILVYGATAGGVVTAIAAAKEGVSVIIVEPGQHIGGMLTGGLSHTDFGDRAVIGGLALEFYEKVSQYYKKELYFWRGPEPHVGEEILKTWLAELNVKIVYGSRLKSVTKKNNYIENIEMINGDNYTAKIYVDGTYEGDLLARAGISYTIGREGISKYGESWAGRQPLVAPSHNFNAPVSPFVNGRNGELLPLINPEPLVPVGENDKAVQAYCFRLLMTNDPDNKIPIAKPADYDPKRFELLRRYMYALKPSTLRETGIFQAGINLPNDKAEINSFGAISTNLYDGSNWAYPDADYALRDSIWNDHISYTRGLLYFAVSDSSLTQTIREEAKEWGLCKDEFPDTGYLPHQLYVREARRMIGEYVLTQHDLMENVRKYDGVGMGSYNMDIRHNQRTYHYLSRFPELVPETVNEGYLSIPVKPYEIPYRSLLPKYEECTNLIVPICISSSNLAYSSFRMEPQYMIAGHAAGLAAAIACQENLELHRIPINKLQSKLVLQNQIISFDESPNGYFEKNNTVIVDDDMTRFVEKDGAWGMSEDPNMGRHDITFLYSNPKENAKITYRPHLPKTGKYKVYGWWPKSKNAASNIKIVIATSRDQKEIEVNQRTTGNKWVFLGTYELEKGQNNEVRFANLNTDGNVFADAFKFEYVD